MLQQNNTTQKRRSVKLKKDELSALRSVCKGYDTVIEAAEAIGIHRNTLDRVILLGSGRPENIEKIRAFIGEFQKAA